ncbi:TPA: sulfite exporter TauE/SafE family protein [Legionella pneumophila]|uniref:Probable membrane transporter protein n=1 Tax=Legionella jordanis TaxID=456 RepID=A0A0W0VAE1_9GAMM|nr:MULTISPECIES: sulfite exporter TauE/SafE family protein [Legionella]KTD16822.1 Sulfite exporter TauE/SafE [Legionella jordanis]MCK1847905.1 sulfite exporter TauE/SafE family protein [Legionella pneumophila]RMW99097.1 sulfite exporter TauE/SafE family protein [Legionella jordanis]RMX14979.1 sulfite exporter TauE/SafE family protein [Legionella jordanis]VEH11710.1 Sulfite exporter TauE/SafE [Legionella jordanis]
MVLLGYSLALLMGLILGMIGAGGSILTMPILVYLLGVTPMVATGYSLMVAGSAAFLGAISYWRQKQIYLKAALIFAIPAMITVFLTRAYLVSHLPDSIIGVSLDHFIMILFSFLMIIASSFLFMPLAIPSSNSSQNWNIKQYSKAITSSICVGIISGLVGAGGGFLIVPALMAFFDLQVKEAIGTSLAIIAINALAGINGDIASGVVFDWSFLILFTILTLSGLIFGISIGSKLQDRRLKTLFSLFALLIGITIFVKEIISLF